MKKFISAILTICLAGAILAGCGYSDALSNASSSTSETNAESSQASTEPTINTNDYENTLDGLSEYFRNMGYIVEKVEDTPASTEMDAELIGAEKGIKYVTKYNGQDVIVELYSYNTENLNDTAKEIINSVKEKGTFAILPDKDGNYLSEVTAYLSDNGKFLMIYSDKSIDKTNPDTTTDNYKHQEKVIEDFKAFHK